LQAKGETGYKQRENKHPLALRLTSLVTFGEQVRRLPVAKSDHQKTCNRAAERMLYGVGYNDRKATFSGLISPTK